MKRESKIEGAPIESLSKGRLRGEPVAIVDIGSNSVRLVDL